MNTYRCYHTADGLAYAQDVSADSIVTAATRFAEMFDRMVGGRPQTDRHVAVLTSDGREYHCTVHCIDEPVYYAEIVR